LDRRGGPHRQGHARRQGSANEALLVDAQAAGSATQFEYANMIGESAVMRQIYEQVSQVARTNADRAAARRVG